MEDTVKHASMLLFSLWKFRIILQHCIFCMMKLSSNSNNLTELMVASTPRVIIGCLFFLCQYNVLLYHGMLLS